MRVAQKLLLVLKKLFIAFWYFIHITLLYTIYISISQKLLGALIIGRGSAQQGVVEEGVKGVKYAPMPPGMYENGKKQAVSHTFMLINCQKCHFLLKST